MEIFLEKFKVSITSGSFTCRNEGDKPMFLIHLS